MLDSPHAMCLGWGPQLITFFNDAYTPLLGKRAERALGEPLAQVWPDEWASLAPLVAQALAGEPFLSENFLLRTTRNDVEERAYFSFSYSAVRDCEGEVVGMLCLTTETTDQLTAQRQLQASYPAMSEEVLARKAERARTWALSPDLLGIARFDGRQWPGY